MGLDWLAFSRLVSGVVRTHRVGFLNPDELIDQSSRLLLLFLSFFFVYTLSCTYVWVVALCIGLRNRFISVWGIFRVTLLNKYEFFKKKKKPARAAACRHLRLGPRLLSSLSSEVSETEGPLPARAAEVPWWVFSNCGGGCRPARSQ